MCIAVDAQRGIRRRRFVTAQGVAGFRDCHAFVLGIRGDLKGEPYSVSLSSKILLSEQLGIAPQIFTRPNSTVRQIRTAIGDDDLAGSDVTVGDAVIVVFSDGGLVDDDPIVDVQVERTADHRRLIGSRTHLRQFK